MPTNNKLKIAILDPFLGNSHKQVWESYVNNSIYDVNIYPYTDKNWKLSSGLSSFTSSMPNSFELDSFDLFLVSEYFDISSFKGMNKFALNKKFICYFHENQFEYPVSVNDKRDDQFSIINLKNYLCADLVVFNSGWNKESFLKGISRFRRALPSHIRGQIPDKKSIIDLENAKPSLVLYPGHNLTNELYTELQSKRSIREGESSDVSKKSNAPLNFPLQVTWNHRWEHDKGLELLVTLLKKISSLNWLDLSFNICGEEVGNQEFKDRLNSFDSGLFSNIGFYHSKNDYYSALTNSDVILSTANHEFYGISVLEAVILGATPLLPNKLSYPELYLEDFPENFYESEEDLLEKLKTMYKQKNSSHTTLNSDRISICDKYFKKHNPTVFSKFLDQAVGRLFK